MSAPMCRQFLQALSRCPLRLRLRAKAGKLTRPSKSPARTSAQDFSISGPVACLALVQAQRSRSALAGEIAALARAVHGDSNGPIHVEIAVEEAAAIAVGRHLVDQSKQQSQAGTQSARRLQRIAVAAILTIA